jgi:hypothetical protein
MINLGTITPMNFDGYLILSLSKDWINQFSGIPKFSVMINKSGKLCITSESSIEKGEKFA